MKENLRKQNSLGGDFPGAPVTPASRTPRKNYKKPSVVYQAPLEAMAATCIVRGGKHVLPCTSAFS